MVTFSNPPHSQAGTVRHASLSQYDRHKRLDRTYFQAEFMGNLLVQHAGSHEIDYLYFAMGQGFAKQ
jgi:hypothetical protein